MGARRGLGGVGALLAFVTVMSIVAWRVVAGTFTGAVVGPVAGGLLGDALTADDSGAPVDWGALVGLGIGVVIGVIAGFVLGTVWHVRHAHRRDEGRTIGSRSLPERSV
jgi:MFS family permease